MLDNLAFTDVRSVDPTSTLLEGTELNLIRLFFELCSPVKIGLDLEQIAIEVLLVYDVV